MNPIKDAVDEFVHEFNMDSEKQLESNNNMKNVAEKLNSMFSTVKPFDLDYINSKIETAEHISEVYRKNPCEGCEVAEKIKQECINSCESTFEAVKMFEEKVKKCSCETAEVYMKDNVNHPSHYTSGAVECIDVMKTCFGIEELMIYCKINAFKYLFRTNFKNHDEDIRKASWYLNKYKELSDEFEKTKKEKE